LALALFKTALEAFLSPHCGKFIVFNFASIANVLHPLKVPATTLATSAEGYLQEALE